MSFSVALAGKGGTGKTTLAGMLIKYLVMKEKTPILAVDADCNANLNEVLGLRVSDTIGSAREEMKKGVQPEAYGNVWVDHFIYEKGNIIIPKTDTERNYMRKPILMFENQYITQ